jgi:hypothetical protein
MKTAVIWLIQELKENSLLTFDEWKELFEQSEEMEKEQIESAYRKGYTESSWGRHSNSENYYNETFKSE